MTHQIIKVEGMSCGHCVETISEGVGKMPGITGVDVKLDKKEVAVDFDESKANIKSIAGKIKELGFETPDN